MAKTPKLVLFLVALLLVTPALAATNNFIADGNITVDTVTFGDTTADMLIMDTSTAESWEYSSSTFTVTNAGTFMVGSSDSAVKGIKVTLDGAIVACAKNHAAGTSYVTVPTASGTYTITPITTNIANSLTYNSSCGAATCSSGYSVQGSGAGADCAVQAGGSSPSGGTTTTTTTTTPVTCTSWTYSNWGTCSASGQQTRTIVSSSPSGCTGGSPATSQSCTPTTTPTPAEVTTPATPAEVTTPAATAEKVSTTVGVPATDSSGKITLEQMATDAKTVATADVNQVIAEMGVNRNATAEKTYNEGIVAKVVAGTSITTEVRNTINNFVAYGTKATKILGAGERAGVVNSFKAALGKLPTTQTDWNDVIKIANGRWPSQTSKTAEDKATLNFKKVYLRDPNRTNAHDDAAVTVMAYGLRPADRNLNSEKAAIKSFKAIYGYAPSAATAWDVVRAVAYSGAKR